MRFEAVHGAKMPPDGQAAPGDAYGKLPEIGKDGRIGKGIAAVVKHRHGLAVFIAHPDIGAGHGGGAYYTYIDDPGAQGFENLVAGTLIKLVAHGGETASEGVQLIFQYRGKAGGADAQTQYTA